MKILIAYSSLTGNTKFLCEGVYDGIKDKYDVEICTVKEAKKMDLSSFDTMMVGYWVDKGTANKEAMKFIKTLANKRVVFLATLGAAPDSEHGQKVTSRMPELVDESSEFLGGFLARGKVDEKLIKRLKFLPLPKKIRDQMYDASIHSRPTNEEDVANAIAYVEGILSK